MDNIALSPCVTSAKSKLPTQVTAWQFLKDLLRMHPEYVHHQMTEDDFKKVDEAFKGDTKSVEKWLEMISSKYPKETLLHTRLVMLGLIEIDPTIQSLFPEKIYQLLKTEMVWK